MCACVRVCVFVCGCVGVWGCGGVVGVNVTLHEYTCTYIHTPGTYVHTPGTYICAYIQADTLLFIMCVGTSASGVQPGSQLCQQN